MKITCLVACLNSNGEPELIHTSVTCSQEEYDNGEHYDTAKTQVEALGYEKASWVADPRDPGFIPPPPNTVDMILDAIDRADRVTQWGPSGENEASFFTGTPDADDETCTVIGLHDGKDITVGDLADAQITPDGTGFTLNGFTYRLTQSIPVWIGKAAKKEEETILIGGTESPIYSVFVLQDNHTWRQPNVRFQSDASRRISVSEASDIVARHFGGMLCTNLAEDPDCPEGQETVISC